MYIDDILVTGSFEQEHLHNLAQVLQRLEAAGMTLRRKNVSSSYLLLHTWVMQSVLEAYARLMSK